MSKTINQLITTECRINQIKNWLKTVHQLNMEEFIILYKIYSVDKISGRDLKDILIFDFDWNSSKIDVIVRKLYKKHFITKERFLSDERQVFYLLTKAQREATLAIINELHRY